MLFIVKTLALHFSAVVYALLEYFYSVIKNDGHHIDAQIKGATYNGLVLVLTETTCVLLFLFATTKLYTYLWGSVPSMTLLQIAIAVVLIDILYYFYHRLHHKIPQLFVIHRIHHVGVNYNLSLAIMLPWIGQASIYLMFVPLVFLHLTPLSIISAYFFFLTYQFFCHIAYLQVPHWCDLFLVTPRNHRIHHLHDRYSQSHNFGSVFSIWDRLFSTYTDGAKDGKATFGIQGNIQTNFFALQKETVMQFFKK